MNDLLTVQKFLLQVTRQLFESPTAYLDAQLILSRSCRWPTAQLWARLNDPFPEAALELAEQWIERRINGEPMAYILGQRDFWDFNLQVNCHTLIPRPETELLVESALLKLPLQGWVIDAGTGSGAIAIALRAAMSDYEVLALDMSLNALDMAKLNAALVPKKIHFLCGHWLQSVRDNCAMMIVSNPPYIAEHDPHLLEGDIVFEPRSALVAGITGLETYQELIPEAFRVLQSSGWLGVEHGIDQHEAIKKIFSRSGFKHIELLQDLSHISRVIWGQKP